MPAIYNRKYEHKEPNELDLTREVEHLSFNELSHPKLRQKVNVAFADLVMDISSANSNKRLSDLNLEDNTSLHTQLLANNQKFTREKYQLSKQIASLNRELQFVKGQWNESLCAHRECENKFAKYEEEIRSRDAQIKALVEKCSSLEKQVLNAEREYELLTEQLNSQLTSFGFQKTQLLSKLSLSIEEHKRVEQFNAQLQKDVAALEDKLAFMHSALSTNSHKAQQAESELLNVNNEYQQVMSEQKVERENHLRVSSHLKTQLSNASVEIESLRSNVKQCEERIQQLNQQVNITNAECSSLKEKTIADTNSLNLQRNLLQKLETVIAARDQQIATLQQQLNMTQSQYQTANETIAQSKHQMDGQTKEIDDLHKQINSIKNDHNEKRSALLQKLKDIEQQNDVLKVQLNCSHSRTEEKHKNYDLQISSLNVQINTQEQLINDLQKSNAALNSETVELEAIVQQRLNQINQLTAQNSIESRKNIEIEDKLNYYTQLVQSTREKYNKLKTDHSECQHLQSLYEINEKELNEKRSEVRKCRIEIDELKDQLTHRARIIDLLQQQNNEYQQKTSNFDMFDQVQQRLNESLATIENQKQQISDLRVKLRNFKYTSGTLSKSSRPQSSTRSPAKIDNNVSNHRIITLENEIEQLNQQISELQRSKDVLVNSAMMTEQSLRSELSHSNKGIEQLKTQLTKQIEMNLNASKESSTLTSVCKELTLKASELNHELITNQQLLTSTQSQLMSKVEFERACMNMAQACSDALSSSTPFLGLSTNHLSLKDKTGVFVEEVSPQSSCHASQAILNGLEKNDVIEQINGETVKNISDYAKITRQLKVNQIITISHARYGNTITSVVNVGTTNFTIDELKIIEKWANFDPKTQLKTINDLTSKFSQILSPSTIKKLPVNVLPNDLNINSISSTKMELS